MTKKHTPDSWDFWRSIIVLCLMITSILTGMKCHRLQSELEKVKAEIKELHK